jgi:hypothetical protein
MRNVVRTALAFVWPAILVLALVAIKLHATLRGGQDNLGD